MNAVTSARTLRRVVEIEVAAANRHGTGYVVGDALVLTAEHLVRDATRAAVRMIGHDRRHKVDIAWSDRKADAALLRATAPLWADLPDRGALRWGTVTGELPVPCFARGFPWSMRGPDQVYDLEVARGQIAPGAGIESGRYLIDIEGARPDEGPPEGSPWGGISGGPLLSMHGRHLLGVIIKQPQGFGFARLAALPVSDLIKQREFTEALGYQPALNPVSWVAGGSLLSDHLDEPFVPLGPRYADAALLRAEHGIVPLQRHREGQIDDENALAQWCASAEVFSLGLLTGTGGTGKSRLAAETCRHMLDAGWDAGFAAGLPDNLDLVDLDWPALIVVDEADQRASAITALINRYSKLGDGPRLRVLLIARTRTFLDKLDHDGTLQALTDQALHLQPLDEDDRGAHAAAAVTAFASTLRVPAVAPPDVTDPEYATPLLVHVAALLAVRGEHVDGAGSGPLRAKLLGTLVNRERTRWMSLQSEFGLGDMETEQVTQAVALATITTPHIDQTADLLAAIPAYVTVDSERRAKIATWLAELFGNAAGQLDPLRPDLLAETLLNQTPGLDHIAVGIHHLNAWDPSHSVRMLEVLRLGASGSMIQQALRRVLTDQLPRFAAHISAHPTHTMVDILQAAVQAGNENPQAADWKLVEACLTADKALPGVTARLSSLAVSIADLAVTCAEALEKSDQKDPGTLGRAQLTLSRRMYAVGQHDVSRTAIEAGLNNLVLASESDPARYRRELATAWATLALQQGRAWGNPKSAITADQKALAMYIELRATEPDRYQSQLSGVLQNLGNWHDALGSPQSVTYTAEALRMRKESAGEDLREQVLVATLTNNLANQFLHLGKRRKARKTVLEGIEELRRLAYDVPEDALPFLSQGLSIYARVLATEQRFAEAITAMDESLAKFREASQVNPERHLIAFSERLVKSIQFFDSLGDRKRGTQCLVEVVDIFRELARTSPRQYLTGLGEGLHQLAIRYRNTGYAKEAHAASAEAEEVAGLAALFSGG
jgi:hypothetical protein